MQPENGGSEYGGPLDQFWSTEELIDLLIDRCAKIGVTVAVDTMTIGDTAISRVRLMDGDIEVLSTHNLASVEHTEQGVRKLVLKVLREID